jgi:hypothetical protein
VIQKDKERHISSSLSVIGMDEVMVVVLINTNAKDAGSSS